VPIPGTSNKTAELLRDVRTALRKDVTLEVARRLVAIPRWQPTYQQWKLARALATAVPELRRGEGWTDAEWAHVAAYELAASRVRAEYARIAAATASAYKRRMRDLAQWQERALAPLQTPYTRAARLNVDDLPDADIEAIVMSGHPEATEAQRIQDLRAGALQAARGTGAAAMPDPANLQAAPPGFPALQPFPDR